MRSVENEKKKLGFRKSPKKNYPHYQINPKKFTFLLPIHHSSFSNLDTERGKRGLDNMEINK